MKEELITFISSTPSLIFFGVNASLVLLFIKGWLPLLIAKPVGRAIHYPGLAAIWLLFKLGLRGEWWTEIDDTVILGAIPFSYHVPKLKSLGVSATINMCDESIGPIEELSRYEIVQHWFPTVDHFEPDLNDIDAAVKLLINYRNNNSKVYVHCRAGRGRSAAVVFAYLISIGHSATEAQSILSTKRPNVRSKLASQPNLRKFQVQFELNKKYNNNK